MAFEDLYRISVHAVFENEQKQILQLLSTYEGGRWGLPGGALDPGETIHEALIRECREELAVDIEILYMSGMYFHKAYNSHACILKCNMPHNSQIQLSTEHSEYKYFDFGDLSKIQQHRIKDCLEFTGQVKSYSF